MHVAGYKYAGVSVREPLTCYHVNVEGTRILVEQCLAADVRAVVFSSSAAVFGTPDVDLVTEDTPKAPESPYGESKLIGEWLLRDTARAAEQLGEAPFRHTSLRYFNVVGSGIPTVYDVSPHNLFPIVLAAVTRRTPTGRVRRRLRDARRLLRPRLHPRERRRDRPRRGRARPRGRASPIAPAYNLGRGEGISVKEIIAAIEKTLGRPLPYDVGPRRPGDPDRIVTSADRAHADLGWAATEDLDAMVEQRLDRLDPAAPPAPPTSADAGTSARGCPSAQTAVRS